MRPRLVLAFLLLAVLATPARSQEASSPPGPPAEDRRARGGTDGRGRNPMADWFIRDLDRNVGLTDEQKSQLRELMQDLRRQAREQFRNNPPNAQNWETFRDLRRQLEQAAAAGNESEVAEIQKQLESTGGAGLFRRMRARSFDQIRKVLNPDQMEAFEQWRALQESRVPQPLLADPASLKQAINGISTLSDAQKQNLDAAISRYEQQLAASGPDAPADANALRNRLARHIQNVLKPSQQVLLGSAWRDQMMANNPRWQGRMRPGDSQNPGPDNWFGRRAQDRSPRAESTQPDPRSADAWTAYVEAFAVRYNLDNAQRETAWSILRELQGRAAEYRLSRRTDLEMLTRKVSQAASPEERAAAERERTALEQPIAGMFQELKDRLAVLPTAAQLAAASQPTADPRPAGSRRNRAGRAADTQSNRSP